MKGILHTHTNISPCSDLDLKNFISKCQKEGIEFAAVTDHNTIEAAVELQKTAPLRVIIGEEIGTRQGEIIGLFLREKIEPKQTAVETMLTIKRQGGLVYLPHPYDVVRRMSKLLKIRKILPYMDLVDIVEVSNSRNVFPYSDTQAHAFADEYQKVQAVGSDAHFPNEIGKTYVEMEPFETAQEFLRSLSTAKLTFTRSSPHYHILSAWTRFKKWYS